jgi:VWFA-related protein
LRRTLIAILSFILVLLTAAYSSAQTAKPQTSPTPPDEPRVEGQESVKVFTEEVRLPVNAMDAYGHYDPALEVDDVLVLEDGVPQQIKSVRHIPANVLFILDTGGDSNGLGGLSKKASTTRAVAFRVLARLRPGDRIAVLQSSNKAELLQPWTDDVDTVKRVVQWKLFAARRSRIFETMTMAAQVLSDQPEGSRHVVLVTDGVESPGGRVAVDEAIKQLVAARATVHIISYTEFVRQAEDKIKTLGAERPPSFNEGIRFDPAMKKVRKAYESETRKSEKWLTALAKETGGRMFLPISTEEMIASGEDAARDIGAEYVVTYRPTRPLSEAKPGEYRTVHVVARRVGLYLRSRQGYVVPDNK